MGRECGGSEAGTKEEGILGGFERSEGTGRRGGWGHGQGGEGKVMRFRGAGVGFETDR